MFQDSAKDFSVFTFNQSLVRVLEATEGVEIGSVDTQYNYNDKEKKWERGESDWESVGLICTAYGGRPLPAYRWFINDNVDKDLHDYALFE